MSLKISQFPGFPFKIFEFFYIFKQFWKQKQISSFSGYIYRSGTYGITHQPRISLVWWVRPHSPIFAHISQFLRRMWPKMSKICPKIWRVIRLTKTIFYNCDWECINSGSVETSLTTTLSLLSVLENVIPFICRSNCSLNARSLSRSFWFDFNFSFSIFIWFSIRIKLLFPVVLFIVVSLNVGGV